MDYAVLMILGGGVVGGLAGLFVVGVAGCITLAMNARGLSELT
jgi:hypothetical protein